MNPEKRFIGMDVAHGPSRTDFGTVVICEGESKVLTFLQLEHAVRLSLERLKTGILEIRKSAMTAGVSITGFNHAISIAGGGLRVWDSLRLKYDRRGVAWSRRQRLKRARRARNARYREMRRHIEANQIRFPRLNLC